MSQPIYEFTGDGRKVILYPDCVVIDRSNEHVTFGYDGIHGFEKTSNTIQFSDISSVEFSEAKKMFLGCRIGLFRILLKGTSIASMSDPYNPHCDPNLIQFGSTSSKEENIELNQCALKMKQLIEERISDNNQSKEVPKNSVSNADEIKKYKELLDMGAISQEEFDVKKKQLLGL